MLSTRRSGTGPSAFRESGYVVHSYLLCLFVPSLTALQEKTPESILLGMEGVTNAFDYPATKPCEQCVLLGINASMEYADGTIAETSNGVCA